MLVLAGLGKKERPYLQNYQNKKDWKYGSKKLGSSLASMSPKFKPQYCQKKKKERKKPIQKSIVVFKVI
jgi:hypothetical protein